MKLTIEQEWQKFLERCGVSEKQLPDVQRIEMKKSFFGCAASLLVMFRDEIGPMPHDKAVEQMEALWQEVTKFWIDQIPAN